MFSLFWVPNFIKFRYIAILRPNLPNYNFGSRSSISDIIFMINKLDLLSVPNFIALGYISFLEPNFLGMGGLILILISNVCYLTEILIVIIVTWWCSLSSGYCWLLLVTWWLLLVTGGSCSLPLVTACSHF